MGREIEQALWSQGCATWDDFLEDELRFSCGSADRASVLKALRRSAKSLENGEHQFFRKGLGMQESWRAFPEFRSSCVYLDIETDGGQRGSSITTVGLFDGAEYRCLIKGEDLGCFPDVISHYSMIVTFSGAGYDLPMLQRCFPMLRFDQIHIDLCPTLRKLGLQGGLKSIEKQLGISRSEATAGLGGLDAIRLWRRYMTLQDEGALETLISYNREDVVNLERLAEHAYENLKRCTFVAAGLLEG
jgi:uncharacterized protein YprB with RNaseH-like and TPR domain